MMDENCFYCTKNDQLESLMIELFPMKISTLYLLKDQTHLGRCVLAFNNHKTELFQLTEQERILLMDDVSEASERLYHAFSANKINYAIYGDEVSHLHFHLVPKYKEGEDWGQAFVNMPSRKKILSSDQYEEISEKISQAKIAR